MMQQTGKPVYRMGSFAPNRGAVGANGAQGYLKRELRKGMVRQNGGGGPFGGVSNWGRDGASDTRSGVAQRMLRRPIAGSGALPPGYGGSKGGKQGGMPNWGKDDGRPMMGGTKPGGLPDWGKDDGRPMGGKQGGMPNWGKDDGRPMGAAQPPRVTIGKDGTLQLPFDYQNAQQALTAQQQLNSTLLDLQGQSQQAQAAYLSGLRENELGYANAGRDALNDRASSGAAFSSAYGSDVSNLANVFNNRNAELNTNYGMFNSNAQSQKNQAVNYMNQLLQQLAVDRAEGLHGQAGQLGYGKIPNRIAGGPKGNYAQISGVRPHGNKAKGPKGTQRDRKGYKK